MKDINKIRKGLNIFKWKDKGCKYQELVTELTGLPRPTKVEKTRLS